MICPFFSYLGKFNTNFHSIYRVTGALTAVRSLGMLYWDLYVHILYFIMSSRYSDSLRAGRSGDRIPVGSRFSALFLTGLGVHPTSCTMGNGSFSGAKRPGRDADPSPLPVPWSRKSRAIPLLPLWVFVACYRGNFIFHIIFAISVKFGMRI